LCSWDRFSELVCCSAGSVLFKVGIERCNVGYERENNRALKHEMKVILEERGRRYTKGATKDWVWKRRRLGIRLSSAKHPTPMTNVWLTRTWRCACAKPLRDAFVAGFLR